MIADTGYINLAFVPTIIKEAAIKEHDKNKAK